MRGAKLYFDGACMPHNPGGVATYGYILEGEDGGRFYGSGVAAERGTNNVAEYTALIRGMEFALGRGVRRLTVLGDSQLAIRQMQGVYAVKSPRIYPLWRRAVELASQFEKIRFVWIPREENKEADLLSTQAYVDFMEGRARERAAEIRGDEIISLGAGKFRVRNYEVNLNSMTCTCPFFRKMSSYALHKRSGIKIRCKHIFAAADYQHEP